MADVRVHVIVEVAEAGVRGNTERVDVNDHYHVGDNPQFLPDELRERVARTVAKVCDRLEHMHQPIVTKPASSVR